MSKWLNSANFENGAPGMNAMGTQVTGKFS